MGWIVLFGLLCCAAAAAAAATSAALNLTSPEEDGFEVSLSEELADAEEFGFLSQELADTKEFDWSLSEKLADAEEFVTGAGAGGLAGTENVDRRAISAAVREMVKECGAKGIRLHYDTLLKETLTCNAAAVARTKALKTRLLRTYRLNEPQLKVIAQKVGAGLSLSVQEKQLVTSDIFEPICSVQLHVNDCGPPPGSDPTNYLEMAKSMECETQLTRDTGELIWIASQDLCKRNMSWLFEYLDSRPCAEQIRAAATSTINRDREERVKEYMEGFSNKHVRQVMKGNPNETWAEICFNSAELGRVYKNVFDVDSCNAYGRRWITEQAPFQIWLDTFKATSEFWTAKCGHFPSPVNRTPAFAPRPRERDFNWDPPPPIIRVEEPFKTNSGVSSWTVLTLVLGILGVVVGLIKMCQAYKKSSSSAESTG